MSMTQRALIPATALIPAMAVSIVLALTAPGAAGDQPRGQAGHQAGHQANLGARRAAPPPLATGPIATLAPKGFFQAVSVARNGKTTVVYAVGTKIKAITQPDGGSWGAAVTLGRGDWPQIGADAAGNVTVVWQRWSKTSGRRVMATRRPAGGTWQPAEAISAPLPRGGAYASSLAVSSGGSAVVGWDFGYRKASTDQAFYRAQAAFRPAHGGWQQPEDITTDPGPYTFPQMGIGPAGKAVTIMRKPRGKDLVLASQRHSDGSWTAPTAISGPRSDVGWVVVGPRGLIVAMWTNESPASGSGFSYQAATGRMGGSWSAPHTLTNGAWEASLAIDGRGTAIAAWTRVDGRVQAVRRPAGRAWGQRVNLAGKGDTGEVTVATNGDGDAIVGWTRRSPTDWKVVASMRPHGGAWSASGAVTPPDGSAYGTALGVYPNGDAVVVWRGNTTSALYARRIFMP